MIKAQLSKGLSKCFLEQFETEKSIDISIIIIPSYPVVTERKTNVLSNAQLHFVYQNLPWPAKVMTRSWPSCAEAA